MSTHSNPTRRTDPRTDREEREAEAPLCPDLGPSGTDTSPNLRRELRRIHERLDRIERRMDAEGDR